MIDPVPIPARGGEAGQPLAVRPGDTIVVRAYIHNNATPANNRGGSGPSVATNSRVRFSWPTRKVGLNLPLSAYVYADNAQPDKERPELHTISASASLISQSGAPISVRYVPGSARLLQYRPADRCNFKTSCYQAWSLTGAQESWLFTGARREVAGNTEISGVSGLPVGHDGRYDPTTAVGHSPGESFSLLAGPRHHVLVFVKGQVLDAQRQAAGRSVPVVLDANLAAALVSGPKARTNYRQRLAVRGRDVVELSMVANNTETQNRGKAAEGFRLRFTVPKSPTRQLRVKAEILSDNGASLPPYKLSDDVLLRSADRYPLTLANFRSRSPRVARNRNRNGSVAKFDWDRSDAIPRSRFSVRDLGDRFEIIVRPDRRDRLGPSFARSLKVSLFADVRK